MTCVNVLVFCVASSIQRSTCLLGCRVRCLHNRWFNRQCSDPSGAWCNMPCATDVGTHQQGHEPFRCEGFLCSGTAPFITRKRQLRMIKNVWWLYACSSSVCNQNVPIRAFSRDKESCLVLAISIDRRCRPLTRGSLGSHESDEAKRTSFSTAIKRPSERNRVERGTGTTSNLS